MSKVVPIRPPKRERILIHCNADELASLGKALARAAESGVPELGTLIITSEGKPAFGFERKTSGPNTMTVWSCALSQSLGRPI
jgi:hypothetical protein